MMRRQLAGAVCVVTGAGAGVGEQTARLLAGRGASVVVIDLDEDAAASTVAGLPAGRGLALGADVTDRAAMDDAIAQALAWNERLDVVIANAGIAHRPATFRAIEPEAIERLVRVNMLGVTNTIKPCVEPLIASRGHLVVVASVGALLPAAGGVAYSATKVGVEMLGRGLRVELAPYGVGVTITYFGMVDTAMARMTLDDPLGKAAGQLLPEALRKRITPEEAAAGVVRAVERGAKRVVIPRRWHVLDGMHGLGPLADRFMLRNAETQALVRKLDAARVDLPTQERIAR